MNKNLQSLSLKIPESIKFSDLKLARDPDGEVSFDKSVIEKICEASDISIDVFMDSPEDLLASLITSWYTIHKNSGGKKDPVAEDLLLEMKLEGGYSHQPGRS